MHYIPQKNYIPKETCLEATWRPRLRRAALATAGLLAVGVGYCGLRRPIDDWGGHGLDDHDTASPSAAAGRKQRGSCRTPPACARTACRTSPTPRGNGGDP